MGECTYSPTHSWVVTLDGGYGQLHGPPAALPPICCPRFYAPMRRRRCGQTNLYTAPYRPPSRLFKSQEPKTKSCGATTQSTQHCQAPWCGNTEHFPSTSRTNVEPSDLCQLHITKSVSQQRRLCCVSHHSSLKKRLSSFLSNDPRFRERALPFGRFPGFASSFLL